MEKPHCYWCHRYHDIMIEKQLLKVTRWGIKTVMETELFCSEGCFINALPYLHRYAKYSLGSIIAMVLIIFGIVRSFSISRSLHLDNDLFLALIIFPLGFLLQVIPFTTPEAVQYVGLKKGILMTRTIGIIIVFLGIVLLKLSRI